MFCHISCGTWFVKIKLFKYTQQKKKEKKKKKKFTDFYKNSGLSAKLSFI